MCEDVLGHVQRLPLCEVSKYESSYLTQRINNDANALIIFYLTNAASFISNLITMVIVSGLLFQASLAIMFVVLVDGLVAILMYLLFRKPFNDKSTELKEMQSQYFSKLHGQISNIRFVKLNSATGIFLKKLHVSLEKLIVSSVSMQRTDNAFSFGNGAIDLAVQVIILLIGGYYVLRNEMTIGFLMIVTSFAASVKSSILYFSGLGRSFQQAKASFFRLKSILDIPEQKNGDIIIDCFSSISLKNLTFQYGNKTIFENVDLELKSGVVYGISGDNGTGKSTLISLLTGLFISEYRGEICYNTTELSQIDIVAMRSNIVGVVEQEPFLLPDTIQNNLTLGENIDTKDLDEYFKLLDLCEFIQGLPDGLETVINERAVNISGGEKQKIAIIRQLIKNAEFMIFDEPTSAMDYQSTQNFIKHLHKIKQKKIILLVSHNKMILSQCDAVITLPL